MKTRIPLRTANAQGFSLPEVTLALGIAAFGITTLLGLLPQGLSNIRKAGDVAASARISQQILGSIDQSQATSTTASKQRYYFNAYAVPVDPAGRHKDDIAYVAEVNPPALDVSLPGATNSGDAFLRRVTVKLKQTPAVDYEFDESNPGNYKLYSYVVARTGK